MPRELPQKRCLVDSTHRNQKAAHFRQSVGYPGMGLRRSGEGRDLDVQVLEEMGVATVATAPQLLLLPPVSHRSASQNGHLAHGVLLQALHRVALGSEQLAHEIELLRRHKGKCNENVYPPLTGFQNRNRTHPPPPPTPYPPTYLWVIPHRNGHFDGHLHRLVASDVQHFKFLCGMGNRKMHSA